MSDNQRREPMPVEGQDPIWLAQVIVFLITLMCAAFTFVASSVSLAYEFASEAAPPSLLKLAAKCVVFGVTTLFVAWRLRGMRSLIVDMAVPPPEPRPHTAAASIVLAAVLFAVASLSFVRLDRYPHAEPDETHHLIVARNLAAYGVYGSGRPETGFTILDEYDSVGPTVILPVAAAMRITGGSLGGARAVMAAFYLIYCILLFLLVRPLTGPIAASICILFVLAAPGSIYLARTLYGEVPALLFFVLGLILWRRSLGNPSPLIWLIAAGLTLGLMVVTKSFMLMTTWAFVGMWAYDRITFRRVSLFHVVAPWLVAGAVLLTWILVQDIAHRGSPTTTATQFGMYQHNLMFGLHSVPATFKWLAHNAGLPLFGMLYLSLIAPTVFIRRYDPALILLFLFAPFELYWWIFFTTGNIPRYAWYALAILNISPALLFAVCIRNIVIKSSRSNAIRFATVVIAFAVATPAIWHLAMIANQLVNNDDMKDDRDLAAYVQSLPSDSLIATSFYPAERILNLFANRTVPRIKGIDNKFDKIIIDSVSQVDLLDKANVSKRIGRYAIVEPRR